MNIVNFIISQLSGQSGQLASLLGTSESTTRSAVGAAVPTLLSALSGLTKSPDGAQQVTSALKNFDPSSVNMSQPDSLLSQGTSLLGSLFGGGGGGAGLSSIVGALGNFTGMGSGVMKTLMGYLAPLVLGGIASQFKGKPVTPEGVSSFFEEQKSNISAAMPAGFSLPSFGTAETETETEAEAEAATSDYVERPAAELVAEGKSSGSARWVAPLVLLALLAGLGWYFMGARSDKAPGTVVDRRPSPVASPDLPLETPIETSYPALDSGNIGEMLPKTFRELTDTLATVKDKESAQAALPKLDAVAERAETMKEKSQTLPDSVRAGLKSTTAEYLSSFKSQAEKVLALPGVNDVLGPVVKRIVSALSSLS